VGGQKKGRNGKDYLVRPQEIGPKKKGKRPGEEEREVVTPFKVKERPWGTEGVAYGTPLQNKKEMTVWEEEGGGGKKGGGKGRTTSNSSSCRTGKNDNTRFCQRWGGH